MATVVQTTPAPMTCITMSEQLARFKNGTMVVYKSDNPKLRSYYKQYRENDLFFGYVKGFTNIEERYCFYLYRVWKDQMERNPFFIDPVRLDTYTLTRYREVGSSTHEGTPVDPKAEKDKEYYVSVEMREATAEETAAIVSAVAKKQLSFYPAFPQQKGTDQKQETSEQSEAAKGAGPSFDLARVKWTSIGVEYPA